MLVREDRVIRSMGEEAVASLEAANSPFTGEARVLYDAAGTKG